MKQSNAHSLVEDLAGEQANPYVGGNFTPKMEAHKNYGDQEPRYKVSVKLGRCEEAMLFRLLGKARAHGASFVIQDNEAVFE